MPLQIILNPRKDDDHKLVDLCRKISNTVHRRWEILALSKGFWMLIAYHHSVRDVVDHPLRQQGGREDGKSLLPWYERDHEILGIGKSPADCADLLLRRGKSARLRARQVFGEDRQKHLVFKDLDTGVILWPDQLQRRFS
jgi:hypothetical protein